MRSITLANATVLCCSLVFFVAVAIPTQAQIQLLDVSVSMTGFDGVLLFSNETGAYSATDTLGDAFARAEVDEDSLLVSLGADATGDVPRDSFESVRSEVEISFYLPSPHRLVNIAPDIDADLFYEPPVPDVLSSSLLATSASSGSDAVIVRLKNDEGYLFWVDQSFFDDDDVAGLEDHGEVLEQVSEVLPAGNYTLDALAYAGADRFSGGSVAALARLQIIPIPEPSAALLASAAMTAACGGRRRRPFVDDSHD